MSLKWIIGMVFIWIVAVICTGIAEMQSGMMPSDEVARLQALMQPEIADWISSIPIIGAIAYIVVHAASYFWLFVNLVNFNFATIFSGSMGFLQVVIFAPLAAAIIFGIIATIRGTSSA